MLVLDVGGLIVEGVNEDKYNASVAQFKESYADWDIAGEVPDLHEVIQYSGATALMGFTGCAGLFNEQLVKRMAENAAQPIIFPLSNPNANCEASPQEIADWTEGKAIIATGSPFPAVTYADKDMRIGQGNNAFVFPGIGFAAVLGKCSRITDEMVLESAYALTDYTAEHYLSRGMIYPPVAALRDVSVKVTARVLKVAIEQGASPRQELKDMDLESYVKSRSWQARYLPFVPA